MRWCACASDVYGSVYVCVDCYSCSMINQVQARVFSHVDLDCNLWICKIMLRSSYSEVCLLGMLALKQWVTSFPYNKIKNTSIKKKSSTIQCCQTLPRNYHSTHSTPTHLGELVEPVELPAVVLRRVECSLFRTVRSNYCPWSVAAGTLSS